MVKVTKVTPIIGIGKEIGVEREIMIDNSRMITRRRVVCMLNQEAMTLSRE